MEKVIKILIFGQLEDITGASVVSVSHVTDTDQLVKKLYSHYPLLKEKKFLIAVDQKIITGKTLIGEQTQIALLPPFSGG
jgi:molybdopterin converting factor small subunit